MVYLRARVRIWTGASLLKCAVNRRLAATKSKKVVVQVGQVACAFADLSQALSHCHRFICLESGHVHQEQASHRYTFTARHTSTFNGSLPVPTVASVVRASYLELKLHAPHIRSYLESKFAVGS